MKKYLKFYAFQRDADRPTAKTAHAAGDASAPKRRAHSQDMT